MELSLNQAITVNVAVHYANYKGLANVNHTFDLYIYPQMVCRIYENIDDEVAGMEVMVYFDYYDPDNQIAYYYRNIYISSPE
jgi:hypothetical protein